MALGESTGLKSKSGMLDEEFVFNQEIINQDQKTLESSKTNKESGHEILDSNQKTVETSQKNIGYWGTR